MCLRRTYRDSSRLASVVLEVTKIWNIAGSTALAVSPRIELFTGTSLTARMLSPRDSASPYIMSIHLCFSSLGAKTIPTPYLPFSGTGMPCKSINSCGICVMTPAPSPVLLSALSAPRCTMFSNIRMASSTTLWLLPPLRSAIRPTPQASCSYSLLYKLFIVVVF